MNKHVLNKAIKKAGSQAKLARALGYTRALVCNVKRGTPASSVFIKKVEEYING